MVNKSLLRCIQSIWGCFSLRNKFLAAFLGEDDRRDVSNTRAEIMRMVEGLEEALKVCALHRTCELEVRLLSQRLLGSSDHPLNRVAGLLFLLLVYRFVFDGGASPTLEPATIHSHIMVLCSSLN